MINDIYYDEERDRSNANDRCFYVVCWWGPRFGDEEIGYQQYERICDWFREHVPEPWTRSGASPDGAMNIYLWATVETALKIWRKWSPDKPFNRFDFLDPRRCR